MKLLVGGGCGFIGSEFVRNHLKKNPKDQIINIDNLSIGSNPTNLSMIQNIPNYQFIQDDIKNNDLVKKLSLDVDVIVNFAAETHVDRSINDPSPFIYTNYLGTYALLEASRINEKLFVHISTDEVYGDAKNDESFTENDRLIPSNPYSATKAAADLLVGSYVRTYKTRCIVTRCTNNFGPFQFPEKLIPKTIIRAMKNLKIPMYGGGKQIRSWIYVNDHTDAIESLLHSDKTGIYNIADKNEIPNIEIVQKILKILDKSNDLIESVDDRPGHDWRYSLNSEKIHNDVGWLPKHSFDEALEKTVLWYKDNVNWWEPLATSEILDPFPWKK